MALKTCPWQVNGGFNEIVIEVELKGLTVIHRPENSVP